MKKFEQIYNSIINKRHIIKENTENECLQNTRSELLILQVKDSMQIYKEFYFEKTMTSDLLLFIEALEDYFNCFKELFDEINKSTEIEQMAINDNEDGYGIFIQTYDKGIRIGISIGLTEKTYKEKIKQIVEEFQDKFN